MKLEDIPDQIRTNNPREQIAFAIQYFIKIGTVDPNFKLSAFGYHILTNRLSHYWKERDAQRIQDITTDFIYGYACGQGKLRRPFIK